MEKLYPQQEDRFYLYNNSYLNCLIRQGRATENNMSMADFARNIWLIDEHDNEIWRVHSESDHEGLDFIGLNTSNSEYLAHRLDKEGGTRTFLLHMESGLATPYPKDKSKYEGPELELVRKREIRISLNDEDYLLMDKGLPGTYARNIVRINGKGEEVWRIWPSKADDYDTFSFLFVRNGRCYADRFEKFNYQINVDTGEATYITWEDM